MSILQMPDSIGGASGAIKLNKPNNERGSFSAKGNNSKGNNNRNNKTKQSSCC